MAASERGDEVVFTDATGVPRSRIGALSSTLLTFSGSNALAPDPGGANDRVVTVTKKKTAGSVSTIVASALVPPGSSWNFGMAIACLDAADETVEFSLDGTGTFTGEAVWLDRS